MGEERRKSEQFTEHVAEVLKKMWQREQPREVAEHVAEVKKMWRWEYPFRWWLPINTVVVSMRIFTLLSHTELGLVRF